jgi:hypothetical protein
MQSLRPAPAARQISRIRSGFWREFPDASRPSDWKHVATQSRSTPAHVFDAAAKSYPFVSRTREVTIR